MPRPARSRERRSGAPARPIDAVLLDMDARSRCAGSKRCLPAPPPLIAAEDVARGKPAPDCFQLAAQRLGTAADRCLVVEDSPAGIAAAEAAGTMVLVVTNTRHEPMATRHATILRYGDVVVERSAEGVTIRHADFCCVLPAD